MRQEETNIWEKYGCKDFWDYIEKSDRRNKRTLCIGLTFCFLLFLFALWLGPNRSLQLYPLPIKVIGEGE